MIAIKYAEALELLESKSLKQSEIAKRLNISLDIVKKLSQLNKIYNITDDKELISKIKELNFKALELKHLKYDDELSSVLDKLDKYSSRTEIKNACIQANHSKEEDIKKVKELKDNSDKEIKSEISRKRSLEINIRNLESKKEEIEIVFNNIEIGLENLDPILAALVYNKYITVRNVERGYQEWYLYPVVKQGVKISKADWDYMQRNKIVERIWKRGYEWNYAINRILNIKEFAEYIGKNKRRNNVTELELDKDRAELLKEKDDKIKMHKRAISECDKKIEAIKNSDVFNLDLYKETGDTLTTYKKWVSKRNRIKLKKGTSFIRDVVIDGIKLDTIELDEDNNVIVHIKDIMHAKTRIPGEIAKRYSRGKFQKLRKIAKYIMIHVEVKNPYNSYPYNCIVPLHDLKTWATESGVEIKTDIFDDYEDKVVVTKEDELRYLIALDMSKKFLY